MFATGFNNPLIRLAMNIFKLFSVIEYYTTIYLIVSLF